MLKNRLPIFVTLLNLLICTTILVWLFSDVQPIRAQAPQPFLGRIYLGSAPVTAIFDHSYPLMTSAGSDNFCRDPLNQTTHYDDTPRENPPFGYGYDAHDGIDYDLNYEPVLAADQGDVDYAGWSNPANHTHGLGFYIKIDHSRFGNDYTTIYGHMSVIHALTGEATLPIIIGVSGDTGNSDGSHLHFEVRDAANKPVNPYGWIGAGDDPWSVWTNPGGGCASGHQTGAVSTDLWFRYPALTSGSTQYPSGSPMADLDIGQNPKFFDDSVSTIFTAADTVWGNISYANGAYLENFHHAAIRTSSPGLSAKWDIANLFVGGFHYVFAHIPHHQSPPDDPPQVDPAHYAIYTIKHQGYEDQAIVVQSEYPNTVTDGWAYLGGYNFNNYGDEHVRLSQMSVASSSGRRVFADAIRLNLKPTTTGCPVRAGDSTPVWSVAGDESERIKVTWSGFDAYELGYFNIYRNVKSTTDYWTLVHEQETAVAGEWVDAGLTNGKKYFYWLEIFDCYGTSILEGPQSAIAGAGISATFVPAPAGSR